MSSYFVTCGRGMDYFVVKELHNITGVTSIEAGDGKVFFNYENIEPNESAEPLLNIKSAERIFLHVFKGGKPFRCTIDNLFDDIKGWGKYVDIWRQFQPHQKYFPTNSTEVQAKRLKLSDEPKPITFRINCKCTGNNAQFRNSSSLVFKISKKIQEMLQWTTDLKNPLLEIYFSWNDDYLLIAFPLVKCPLSKRPYLKSISLRTTVCWAMAYCANIKAGYVVCDPMCGAGTLLIELLKHWPVHFVVGIDINPKQLQTAVTNSVYANVTQSVQFLQGSVHDLLLRNESVDAIVCDFPFGLKHGTLDEAKNLLPSALKEMNRICRCDGNIVILISEQLSSYLLEQTQCLFPRSVKQNSNNNESWWKCLSKTGIKLGALPAVIYSFNKRVVNPTRM